MDKVRFFQIVENEWREGYDREWGLGIVTSVDQGDGYVWVTKICSDKDGLYLAPEAVYRNKSRLRQANKVVDDISIELKEK